MSVSSLTDYPHGDYRRYAMRGCICDRCRAAASAKRVEQYRDAVYRKQVGRPLMVDASRARDHLRVLTQAGLGRDAIARASGLSLETLGRLATGETSRLRAERSQALLAVPVPSLPTAVGATRRMQALMLLGWSLRELAARAGIAQGTAQSVARGEPTRMDTRLAVCGLFDRLWMTPPQPVSLPQRQAVGRARAFAVAHGFVPAAAWDDIDDPAETPKL